MYIYTHMYELCLYAGAIIFLQTSLYIFVDMLHYSPPLRAGTQREVIAEGPRTVKHCTLGFRILLITGTPSRGDKGGSSFGDQKSTQEGRGAVGDYVSDT